MKKGEVRQKRGFLYIRNSGAEQAKNETELMQLEMVPWLENQGIVVVEIYKDIGISGRSVSKRTDFQRMMSDVASGRWKGCIGSVYSLSRFGRNARDILNNVEFLKKHDVQFISKKEKFDLSTPYGRAMLTFLSGLSELESDIIGERSTEGRITKAKKKGIPTGGKLPFGRKFNKETGKWSLDDRKAELIRWAADQILNGRGTVEVSNILKQKHGLPLSRNYLRKVLTERCGDTYTINFRKGEEPVKFDIPPILDEATISALMDRFKINKKFNRTDVKNKNLLNEFACCARCGRAIQGKPERKEYKGRVTTYQVYVHPTGSFIDCDCRYRFRKQELEDLVFDMLYEFTWDRAGFYNALEKQVPDKKEVEGLKKIIALNDKELKKVDSKINRLVDAYTDGKMDKEIYSKKESEFLEIKDGIVAELNNQQAKLDRLPNIEKLKAEAKKIRSQLLKYYKSPNRLKDMSHDEKWSLLNYFFSGKDENGEPFGIYIDKDRQGEVTISMHGAYIITAKATKRYKKGPARIRFRAFKNLDDTPDDVQFLKTLNRIHCRQTYTLGRGQTGCREIITRDPC